MEKRCRCIYRLQGAFKKKSQSFNTSSTSKAPMLCSRLMESLIASSDGGCRSLPRTSWKQSTAEHQIEDWPQLFESWECSPPNWCCSVDKYWRLVSLYPHFQHLGPGARFSKVPKLFGCFWSDVILFVSSKQRRFMNGFSGPKSLREFRETGPWSKMHFSLPISNYFKSQLWWSVEHEHKFILAIHGRT